MITYGFSIQGKSHIERGAICQDYNKHVALCGGWYLGVVADGVGSAVHSDIGSRTAVENLCDFCKKKLKIGMTDEEIEDMLCSGYEYAYEAVLRYAEDAANAIEEYDTTLSSALYNGDRVIYGHAGDGGILVRQCDGQIRPITKRQKGVDGSSVLPLRAGISSWDFGIVEDRVAAVLLATDGMLDGVFQPVLVNLPSNISSLARGDFSNDHAYITASEFFMNPHTVYQNPDVQNPDALMARYMHGELDKTDETFFLNALQMSYIEMFGRKDAMELCDGISKYYYAVWALTNVTDDKSVVCMMDETAKVFPQKMEYYLEPNWKWRQESYNALLYGGPMPVVPIDDPLRRRNQKKQGRLESFDEKGDDASSNTRIVSKNDIDHWRQRREKQLEEQKDREKRLQEYLDLQRKKKRKIIKSIVIACICCFAVFVAINCVQKIKSSINDDKRSKLIRSVNNQPSVSPVTSDGSNNRNTANPSPTGENNLPETSSSVDTMLADNSNAPSASLTPNEKKEVRKQAKKFIKELAKVKLYSTSTVQGEEKNNEGKKKRDEFQAKLKNKKLDEKLLDFKAEHSSQDDNTYKQLELSSGEEIEDDIQGIINIIDDKAYGNLGKKEDFEDAFAMEIEDAYGQQTKKKKIIKNLEILLDGCTANPQSEKSVLPKNMNYQGS